MTQELESMAAALEQTGYFRVLRRLVPRTQPDIRSGGPARIGVVLDVETTGTDPRRDEIIELAMAKFAYTDEGDVVGVGSVYEQLRQPSMPIPSVITRLTGISDEMVENKTIDADEVAAFMAPVKLVVAHHAGFDRKFVERLLPAFAEAPWACSMTQVEWQLSGFEGRKLSYLLNAAGLFHDGHRGASDCHAVIELLSRPIGETGRTALAHLLDEAGRTTWRLRALGAPYAQKNWLRSRGYRWNNGDDGHARAWFIDLDEEAVDGEVEALRTEMFVGLEWQPDLTAINALSRFSDRV